MKHRCPAAGTPTLMALLLSATICSTAAARTADGTTQWYTAAKVLLGRAMIDDVSHHGTIGNGMIIGGMADGQLEDDQLDDYSAGAGFAFGRRFGYWAVEAEYAWRYRTDWDVVAATPSIQTITNVFANVETSSIMLNLFRRGTINRDWSWELGAGLGLVHNQADAEYIERAVPGSRNEMLFKDDASETDFSFNVLAGVTRDLGGPWTLDIRYRYIDLGDLEAGPFPSRPGRVSGKHTSHEIQLALEFDL